MEKYLTELIDKILDKTDRDMVPFDSSKTISWKALREAEKIDDANYVPLLISFIENETDKDKRSAAYFILGHIAKNTKNKKATNYLVARIAKETDNNILSSLLERIQYLEKPLDTDITPIIEATRSKEWPIRRSAIQALKRAQHKAAEATLLEYISHTGDQDEHDLWYINTTLADIGTRDSIPFLLSLIDHKKQDVSATALNAILAISDKSELPLFIEQLQQGKNKFTALLGVIKYGDQTVIPHIVKRVKDLLSKKRARQVVTEKGKTEIIFAMEFLSTYANENPEPRKIYELLTTKKSDLLWDNEKKWLEQNKQRFES
jgi:HEAT repeat protein